VQALINGGLEHEASLSYGIGIQIPGCFETSHEVGNFYLGRLCSFPDDRLSMKQKALLRVIVLAKMRIRLAAGIGRAAGIRRAAGV
jgi:hypothetical protein